MPKNNKLIDVAKYLRRFFHQDQNFQIYYFLEGMKTYQYPMLYQQYYQNGPIGHLGLQSELPMKTNFFINQEDDLQKFIKKPKKYSNYYEAISILMNQICIIYIKLKSTELQQFLIQQQKYLLRMEYFVILQIQEVMLNQNYYLNSQQQKLHIYALIQVREIIQKLILLLLELQSMMINYMIQLNTLNYGLMDQKTSQWNICSFQIQYTFYTYCLS
ncbi:unnamed protein product [Paramecium primaurelia]|uniref:Uncharacterized protein n=1 Tax=Paramecium primaurelia TaxID=5886 RepID=A0A8S1M086_PARPR|nr:unnamed protein product [Paramecium primaurelia]